MPEQGVPELIGLPLMRRARISGSWSFVSLNFRLESRTEEEEVMEERDRQVAMLHRKGVSFSDLELNDAKDYEP